MARIEFDNLKLRNGDRVKRIGPSKMNIANLDRHGTVVGYGFKNMWDGRECYYVNWDGTRHVSKVCIHIAFLEKVCEKE